MVSRVGTARLRHDAVVGPSGSWAQAACLQVAHEQSEQTQLAQVSPPQLLHEQTAWLHVAQVQSLQSHVAQLSVQLAHEHTVHSS